MDRYPRVEPLPRAGRYPGDSPEGPWGRSGRARLFGLVSGVTLAIGLIWTLLQPVVYRSSATVLMSAPSAIDAEVTEADIQSVAIQRKILLGEEITRRLGEELDADQVSGLDLNELGQLLRVDPLPDTNLVEMSAKGEEKELLPGLVNSWIDVYLAVRAEEIEQRKQHTMQVVQEELDNLVVKLEQARGALDQYRSRYEIISAERQENEVLARLDGLNKALNNAIEEEVKTRAYLDTLVIAIEKGAQVVPQSERPGVECAIHLGPPGHRDVSAHRRLSADRLGVAAGRRQAASGIVTQSSRDARTVEVGGDLDVADSGVVDHGFALGGGEVAGGCCSDAVEEAHVVDRDRPATVVGLHHRGGRLQTAETCQHRVGRGELLDADTVEPFEHGVDRRVAGGLVGGIIGIEAGALPGCARGERECDQRGEHDRVNGAWTGEPAVAGGGHGAVRLRRYRWSA